MQQPPNGGFPAAGHPSPDARAPVLAPAEAYAAAPAHPAQNPHQERIAQVGLALVVLLMVTVLYFDLSKNLLGK